METVNILPPKDWESRKLIECCTKITDGTHDTPKVTDSGRPFFTAIHVRENGIDYDNCLYLSEDDHRLIYQRCNPERDDILLVNIGAGVCTTALVQVDYEFSIKNVALLKPNKSKVDSRFIDQIIKFNRPIIVTSITNGGAQPFLGLGQIGNLSFTIPTNKEEQESIANVLSDTDTYIESLERLLAKKRLIKKGVIQELLTGKRRLSSFTKPWVKMKLGEIGSFLKGSGIKKDEANSGSIPCIRYGEIYTYHNDIIREFRSFISSEVSTQATKLKTGDILFAGSGETKEEIGKCVAYTLNHEAFAGGDIVILRPTKGVSNFLGYYLNSAPIVLQKASKGQGDAVVHISSASLGAIDIHLPEEEEQSAIAKIILDMDSSIFNLEKELSKARLLKQGMMQELLTGRIRLV